MDSDLRKKLDDIEGQLGWIGEHTDDILTALGEEGAIVQELRAVYSRIDVIARQLDDVIALLHGDE